MNSLRLMSMYIKIIGSNAGLQKPLKAAPMSEIELGAYRQALDGFKPAGQHEDGRD